VNERLDQTLAKLLPDFSRTQIHTWIKTGNVLVNNTTVKASTRLKGGEKICIDIVKQPVVSSWRAQDIPLSIIYEDTSLILVNKPIDMVVHPGAGNADHTLLNALLHHAPTLNTLPRAGILHRLDKNTSGLLIIAKTSSSLKSLSAQLKKRSLVREYKAVVQGTLISGGTVNAPIARHPLQRKHMAVIETGKPAITHYRIIEKYRSHTLLKLALETGRTHQIRVHMTHLRHPIVGDATYGARIQITKGMSSETIQLLRQFKRQALHAFALTFIHPETNQLTRFEIGLPDDISQLIKTLRDDMTCSSSSSK
jgi:23S rRNA pseudouridine1911/1915/1917 synthase